MQPHWKDRPDILEAMQQGYNTRVNCGALCENPYPETSELHAGWREGYLKRKQEDFWMACSGIKPKKA